MNHKGENVSGQKKVSSVGSFRIEDIVHSDSDTVPDFSNRDGSSSKETILHGPHHIILIGHGEQALDRASLSKIVEPISQDIKISKLNYNYFAAPHSASIHISHAVAKGVLEKPRIHVANQFAEPKNDKIGLMSHSEYKHLKFDFVVGRGATCQERVEPSEVLMKRLETSLKEVLAVFPNLVLVCGPTAFYALFEIITKTKRKPTSKYLTVEQFKLSNREWMRVQKGSVCL